MFDVLYAAAPLLVVLALIISMVWSLVLGSLLALLLGFAWKTK